MPVRVGVIGAGWIGKEHIRRLTDTVTGARVTAVTDIDAARAEEAAIPAGARVLPDGAALIGAADVDAVLVTSWGPTHAEHVLNALAAAKPVFCEKPLATTAEDCLRIVEAETALGRRLVQVGFMRRYDAGYRQVKQVIDAGRIGEPLIVHCAHRNPAVPESYTSAMAALDTAVHEIDVLRWLLDDEIVSAQVVTPRATSRRFAHLRDPQIMLFETARGVRVDLEVFVNCRYGYDIQCEVVGEEGLVRLPDPASAGVRTAGQHSTEVLTDWTERFAAAFDTEFREWIAGIAAGTEPTGPSAWDGYAATVITSATVEALESGDVVATGLKPKPALYGGAA
ncbi:Gfo/Idh/MocA family oxidoreductase [Streptomyces turgidiscabies]|uniref:Inositol 2-dehydrogenase n=1 Tax=Streptomyces turgidiscabies (strain Car8) TaxID=698760 RepID=L7FGB8_STRT8|nr:MULTISPECIES: Gfo/Idh/MocA family oxidoreductase [Streptomyces]ELP69735.1 oxidoreductase, NAD-binding domain protein [Streptomyces turgidiscabies Car8]MDX3491407.1 Gfo/Idh/MocA family oxidoreductase [Streptomyces turgidiscabies]GAQ73911.1 inositol 2-dehydrogenase/D-chiro-inositol 3-dehydrogenase [Streptomyces turgidiscabies]